MLYVFSIRKFAVVLLALVFVTPSASYSGPAALPQKQNVNSGVQSYREWKSSKIQDVQAKIKNIKEKISADPNLQLKPNNAGNGLEAGLSKALERESLNLSLTEDLTISDYFVGYLTRQSSLDMAIKDVSLKLTPEEIAELMSAYAGNFFQTKPAASKINSTADLTQ